MAPPDPRTDPFTVTNFLVEIEGVASAGFRECSGLSSETTVVEFRDAADFSRRNIPGLTRYGRIVLKRGMTTNRDLWEWRQTVVNGKTERRSGAIVLLSEDRKPVLRWTFRNGWPAKWDGPSFDASKNEVAIETIEIVHEGLELE